MATLGIVCGLVLVVLGVGGYVASGRASWTALIPAIFGFALLALGILAQNPLHKKLAMHIAVTVAFVGVLGSLKGLLKLPAVLKGRPVARPKAVIAQSVMAVVLVLFCVLSIKRFIEDRAMREGAKETIQNLGT